jgi:hypothetical protein
VTAVHECFVCGEVDYTPTCPRCFSRLSLTLAELPEEHTRLMLEYQPSRTGGDGRSATAVHAPLPCRLDVLSLLGPASRQNPSDARDQVGPVPFAAVLAGWVGVLDEERNLTPCRRNVTAMTERLAAHLGWICTRPWVRDFFTEIEELLKAVRKITLTETRMELVRGLCCPSCGRFSMVRYVPDNYAARCRFCDSIRLDQSDLDALIRGQVTEQTPPDDINRESPDGP